MSEYPKVSRWATIADRDFECDRCECEIKTGQRFFFWEQRGRVCENCAEELKNE